MEIDVSSCIPLRKTRIPILSVLVLTILLLLPMPMPTPTPTLLGLSLLRTSGSVRDNQQTNLNLLRRHRVLITSECTDPAVCKRIIAEDFRNEKPLWKLTCYGHFKQLPCDITGDISYEELRAEAYTDAKRGLSIQAIVEREKNLEKSKLIECENLIQNPYTKHAQSALSNHSSFSTVVTTLPSLTPQNTGTSPFSGFSPQQGSSPNISFPTVSAALPSLTPQNTGPSLFSNLNPQQGSSPNMSFGARPSIPTNNAFAQFQGSVPFGSANAPSGLFGTQVPAQTGQNTFPVQTSANPFSPNPVLFGNGGMNTQGNQVPVQTGGNSFSSNLPNFSTSSLPSSFPLSPPQIQTPPISQPAVLSNGVSDTIAAQQSQMVQNEVLPADASIWSKAEWKLGEIPEQPPPAEYVRESFPLLR
ncbi:zinc finger CCCH domain-containing protein 46 isoform X2 [Silene latifolia]|uniref:zinc finger CCCH domain-containing protein 46 isoform X2 n=1 Tax=Silene latifolia TaxID=37657 RepID=UPI003D76B4DC